MRPFNLKKATSRFVTLEIDEESVKQRVKEAFTERFGEGFVKKIFIGKYPEGYEVVVYLENKKISVADLGTLVNEQMQRRPGLMVKLNGDRSVKYGAVVKVLDAARSAGAARYMLVAERLKTGS